MPAAMGESVAFGHGVYLVCCLNDTGILLQTPASGVGARSEDVSLLC